MGLAAIVAGDLTTAESRAGEFAAVANREAGDLEAAAKLAAQAANRNPLSPLLLLVRREAVELIDSLADAA